MLQQLVLIETLFSNWHRIRDLVGNKDPAANKAIEDLAENLLKAESLTDVNKLIDNLIDLVADTEAEDYLRNLLERNDTSELSPELLRSGDAAVAFPPGQPSTDSLAMQGARDLAQSMSVETEPFPVSVFFTTDRQPENENDFGGGRGGKLSYGIAHLTIPVATHQVGKIERPRWWSTGKNDPDKYIQKGSNQNLQDSNLFLDTLEQASTHCARPDLLVFTHGYNVEFEEAIYRAAQVSYDLQFDGIVVLYSWPSKGKLIRYVTDADSSEISSVHLAEFLRIFDDGPMKKIHMLSHSMGNRVMVHALEKHQEVKTPIGQIVMVAADVDEDKFKAKFPDIRDAGELMTSYVSRRDRALSISSFIRGYNRIGLVADNGPFTIPGMQTVDASAVNTSLVGMRHGYFGDDRSVLSDLGYLLQDGTPAQDRKGIRLASTRTYWEFPG